MALILKQVRGLISLTCAVYFHLQALARANTHKTLDHSLPLQSVINSGTTIEYFSLERGALQGDPVSAYLFILVLEILFLFIKKHPEIKGIEIFEHCFLYSAYTDDTTFFLTDAQSIENLVEIFNTFFLFSRLKPNLKKCEIAGIGALKGVQVTVCGMRCIDLCKKAIKIFGTYFSCNSRIKDECNFLKIFSKIQSVLNLWRYRNLTLEG